MRPVLLAAALLLGACPGQLEGGPGGGGGGDDDDDVNGGCDDVHGCVDAGPGDPPPLGTPDAGTILGSPDAAGPPADPDCYTEPVFPEADIGDLEAAFTGSNWKNTSLAVLQRRWPAGYGLLYEMKDDPQLPGFVDNSSFAALMESLMTMVHEETHGWDYEMALWSDDFYYWLRSDLTFTPPKIDGFPRGEIYSMVEGSGTWLYDDTYLTGTQGTYGWYELLDETNAYINGMAALTFVGEYEPWGISARDGAVAFLYYLELYLKRARTVYPTLYAELKAEPEYVELVKTQWLRTHFFLIYADMFPALGISDDEIEPYLYAPENEQEIELFIGREVNASNCLP